MQANRYRCLFVLSWLLTWVVTIAAILACYRLALGHGRTLTGHDPGHDPGTVRGHLCATQADTCLFEVFLKHGDFEFQTIETRRQILL